MSQLSPSQVKILLVDDDPQSLESTRKILEFAGYQVMTAVDGQQALEIARPDLNTRVVSFDLVVTDVRMPRLGGLEFLRALSLCDDRVPVILMTAFGRVEDAVWAMKFGAVDFLTKPFKRQTLLTAVDAALRRSKVTNRGASTAGVQSGEPNESAVRGGLNGLPYSGSQPLLLGASSSMLRLRDLIKRVAGTHANVLLTGQSGTGKELVAQCLHLQGPRAKKPFIALNCAAVPEQLMESELFGFEKSAFTGATAARQGLFEAAHLGTLLLDEMGDMPLPLQAKLLRVLQQNEVRRLGSTQTIDVDVRVIAATHKDLKVEVAEGRFRQDLLYRLEVVGVHVPALTERLSDIPVLVDHFLKVACARHDKPLMSVSRDVLEVLALHVWPGNVRELANVVERAVVLSRGNEFVIEDLPEHLIQGCGSKVAAKNSTSGSSIFVPLGTPLKDVEELLIRKTLEATDGDKSMTAKLLGINSRTIYRKLGKGDVEL